MEEAHRGLRLCAGATSLALAMESKEKPFANFIHEHKNTAIMCQERLSPDSLNFEVLQILVNDDARECFRQLPKSRRQRDCSV
ncbi:hypothetical protein RB195_019942 [Necator americanus]|uniref:Uncharacterized protein n=1 Tax=Necator americanus TaxID=51031 RepID=A0ABR1CGG3_NECAM